MSGQRLTATVQRPTPPRVVATKQAQRLTAVVSTPPPTRLTATLPRKA